MFDGVAHSILENPGQPITYGGSAKLFAAAASRRPLMISLVELRRALKYIVLTHPFAPIPHPVYPRCVSA